MADHEAPGDDPEHKRKLDNLARLTARDITSITERQSFNGFIDPATARLLQGTKQEEK